MAPSTGVALLASGAFRYRSTPLTVDDRHVGSLVVATILGNEYARELARLSDAGIIITVNDAVVAGTVKRAAHQGRGGVDSRVAQHHVAERRGVRDPSSPGVWTRRASTC